MRSLQYADAKKQGWTLVSHTYSVLTTCKVYNTKMPQNSYILTASLKYAKSTIRRCQKNNGGHWLCILTVSLQHAKSTIQRCQKNTGTVSLEYARSTIPRWQTARVAKSTIRGCQKKVDTGVTDLQCPYNMQSLQYEDAQNQGWTLALHTYSVFKISRVYNTKMPKIKGGNWRYILTASLKDDKVTIRRCQNSRVGIGVTYLQRRVTSVQCPYSMRGLGAGCELKFCWWHPVASV